MIEYLDGIRVRLNEIATSFLMEDQPLTADALKAYFKTGGYVVYTIEDLFNDYMHILSKRVGKDLTQKTYRKYEIASDKFYQIISPKEPVSAITKAVIMDYQASMNRYLDYVTTNGYCQRVKTIVQFGIDKRENQDQSLQRNPSQEGGKERTVSIRGRGGEDPHNRFP